MHVTAEMAPIAKVGGLGDVVTGLARAHLCAGHNVEVILPFYSSLSPSDISDLQHVMDFDVPKGTETEWDGVRETRMQMAEPWSLHTVLTRLHSSILSRSPPVEKNTCDPSVKAPS